MDNAYKSLATAWFQRILTEPASRNDEDTWSMPMPMPSLSSWILNWVDALPRSTGGVLIAGADIV